MNALEQKLASLLPQEMLALLEKIESLEGAENDFAIATYINQTPLTKFERVMLVRAYRRYESRQARFKAMELLFPPNKPVAESYPYITTGGSFISKSIDVAPQLTSIQRSKVGHI